MQLEATANLARSVVRRRCRSLSSQSETREVGRAILETVQRNQMIMIAGKT